MTTPLSTYRLQVHPGFTLDDAASVVPYLASLGVSHLYLSPEFQSSPESEHGYDTTDPNRIDEERGGRAAFDRLLERCRSADLGLVLDIVPNHMCVTAPGNWWWRSVLQLGPTSPKAKFFDIDWESPHAPGRVILPVLGDSLDTLLVRRELSLAAPLGRLRLVYHDHQWPLRPQTLASILRTAGTAEAGPLAEFASELDDIEQAASLTPGLLEHDLALGAVELRLSALLTRDGGIATVLADHLRRLSDPAELPRILAQQHYLPMFWRDGGRKVNYRRFFDIDSLASVRAEDPEVFEAISALSLELIEQPGVDGLRIDHPDGLRDPKLYFERLADRSGAAWIVAEKILEADESLPEDWPVAGTTGYDFLNDALRLLMDPAGEQQLTDLYRQISGRGNSFQDVVLDCKRLAATHLLEADLDRLARLAVPALRELGTEAVREQVAAPLAELGAALPVYRTYLSDDRPHPTPVEREYLTAALDGVRRACPDLDRQLVETIVTLLSSPGQSPRARECAFRFQQLSAPATAKGVEDTAFYRYLRFPALNEVGGDPARWSASASEFHARVRLRQARWPETMLAGSTHDTKRSEDVRARLTVLSEMPGEWASRVREWCEAAGRVSEDVDANDVYLLLHTLVGAWPIDAERTISYMVKAAREAKERTSWRDPDDAYEQSLRDLVEGLLADSVFVASLESFVAAVRLTGRIKSLSQTALRLACPGVPDTYQGCDLWDLSLVDPDNRRPVDFIKRGELLNRILDMPLDQLWASLGDPNDPGLTKLWLTQTLLSLRRVRPEVFSGSGEYIPLQVFGADADRVIAFARGPAGGAPAFLAVLPLRSLRPAGDAEIEIPTPGSARWLNLCDGRTIDPGARKTGELLAGAPLALLIHQENHR